MKGRPLNADWTDTAQARRQLRELAVAGWTLSYLEEQLDTSNETLSAIRRGKRQWIPTSLSQGIAYAHRRLLGVDPVTAGIIPRLSARARNAATREGWTDEGRST